MWAQHIGRLLLSVGGVGTSKLRKGLRADRSGPVHVGSPSARGSHGIEALEPRKLLAAVTWTGAVDDLWSNDGNWTGGHAPSNGDDVTILDGSAHTPVKFTSAAGSLTLGMLTCDDPLVISGGSLTLSGAGNSTASDELDLSGGTLKFSGAGVHFTSTGSMAVSGGTISAESGASATLSATQLTGVNLLAVSGGQLFFPAATSYTGNNYADTTISATGSEARIDLSHLQTFAGGGCHYYNAYYSTHIRAITGGEVDLAGAITLNPAGAVWNDLSFDATSIVDVAAVTSLDRTNLTVTGLTLNFSGVTTLTGVNLIASNSGQLLFPAATSYTGDNYADTTISATGAGAKVDLSHLETLAGGGYHYYNAFYSTHIRAITGGEVDLAGAITLNPAGALWNDLSFDATSLVSISAVTAFDRTTLSVAGLTLNFPAVTTLTGVNLIATNGGQLLFPAATSYTGDNYADTTISATGPGAKIDLSHLHTLAGGGYHYYNAYYATHIRAITGGEVDLAGAITLNPAGALWNDLSFDATSIIHVSTVTSLDHTNLTADGLAITFPAVTTLTSVNLLASGGQLLFPAVVNYTGDNYADTTISATGTGAKIDLSHLHTLAGGGYHYYNAYYSTHIRAVSGGEVDLAGAITLNPAGALWNDLSFDASSIIHVATVTSLDRTNLSVTGLVLNFPAVTTLTSVNLTSTGGGQLLFPAAITYTGDNYADTTISTTGPGARIDLSNLHTLAGGGYHYYNAYYATHIRAIAGGEVDLAGAITLNPVGALWNDLSFDATSIIHVATVTSLDHTSLTVAGLAITFPAVTTLTSVNLLATSNGQLLFPAATSYTGDNYADTTISATGPGAKIDLSHLKTLAGGGYHYYNAFYTTHIHAITGGQVDLAGSIGLNPSGANWNDITFDGVGAAINLTPGSRLTSTAVRIINNATWTVPPSLQFELGGSTLIAVSGAASKLDNHGTLTATAANNSISVDATSQFINHGVIEAAGGGILTISGLLVNADQGILRSAVSGTISLKGDLLGDATSAGNFNPRGTTSFAGTGTAAFPQQIEVMGLDLGAVPSGFDGNFVYSLFTLANATYARLVDQSDNSAGTQPEALYTSSLIIPAGTTLDLNGLHVYTRALQLAGTVVGGTITQVPDSGALTIAASTPGAISQAGELDEWSFYAPAGRTITSLLNPGTSSAPGIPAPLAPALGWAQITLIDPAGNKLATASTGSSGQVLSLTGIVIPTSGIYKLAVRATADHTASTGNYMLAAYDITVDTAPLALGQETLGSIQSPFSVDHWTFALQAGQQIQFDLLKASASLLFSLQGPAGYLPFSNITNDSDLITIPAGDSGLYTLSVNATGDQTGSYSFAVRQTAQTALALSTPYSGQLVGGGQAQLFTVDLSASSPLYVRLTDPSALDHLELYARLGAPPTRQQFDAGASGSGASKSLVIPSAASGTWYILLYAESVASAPGSYTLRADPSPVVVTAVTPIRYGANANANLTLTGAGFTPGSTAALIAADNTVYPAQATTFNTFTQLSTTFNLSTVPRGTYSIRVTNNANQSATLSTAFTVDAAGQAHLETHLTMPAAMGYHISSTIYIQYANTGTAAMPAPLLLLESSLPGDNPLFTLDPNLQVSGYWTSALPDGYSNTIQILASGSTPGILQPGESVTVPVYYAGMQEPWPNPLHNSFQFDLRYFETTDADPADWNSLKSGLKPAGMPDGAWDIIYGNVTSQLGSTWGGYVKLLDDQAAYLAQLGENVTDVGRLWGFAIQQADNTLNPIGSYLATAVDASLPTPGDLSLTFGRVFASSIYGRNISGLLGQGWSSPWESKALISADGTVTITGTAGARRSFQPDSRHAGAYFSSPGDTGSLRADGAGGYLLTEAGGIAASYDFSGALSFVQDTHGNRISAGYFAKRLVSLTALSPQLIPIGQSIAIGYNAAGLISQLKDSQGQTTTFAYDAANQHLLSVTESNGQTTSYSYDTAEGSPSRHALTAITSPAGTHRYFTYDSRGRLASTSGEGGVQKYTFDYSLGRVIVTDILGNTSNLYYNQLGLIARSVDPLGNVTLGAYDDLGNLTSLTNALGQSQTFTYNSIGQVTSWADFRGNRTAFEYAGPYNGLSRMTDAKGNSTSYAYDTSGSLLSIAYPNGSSESFGYDPLGDAISFTSAAGQPTHYTYNAAGQIATASFADGGEFTYAYDARGNLISAADATGTTTFTYNQTTELLTDIAYPGGSALHFTYDTAGRRTRMTERMTDQTDFTTNYQYNAAGWLAGLTDGAGNPIVTYEYCNCGHLAKKTNGNGTFTTYEYDPDGRLIHLINHAPNGSVNSRFDYTYNTLGLQTGETTSDGAWTYGYDADGQLTRAVFASTNPDVPGQDLAYSYDALGNRTVTVLNGITTAYITNNMNQYSSVGGVPFTYDANGNLLSDGTDTYSYNTTNQLTSITGPSGTTTYEYNALGQMVASTTNGVTTRYLTDPFGLGNVVGTTVASDPTTHYTYGLGLVSQVGAGGTFYYDFDLVGSTVGLSNSAGSYVNRYTYSPFGGLTSSTSVIQNPFQFVGKWGVRAGIDGLDYMRARFYSSTHGRFPQQDPRRLAGLDVNYYRYSQNDPVTRIDPIGLWNENIEKAGDVIGHIGDFFQFFNFYENFKNYFKTIADNLGGRYRDPREVGASIMGTIPPLLDSPVAPITMPPGFDFPDLGGPKTNPSGPGSPNNPVDPLQPPNGTPGGGGDSANPTRIDPNALTGPAGFGSSNFIPGTGVLFPYTIQFENESAATAPVQQVQVFCNLSPDLDWTTFELTGIAWGDFHLTIPAGSQHYQTTVSMTYNGQTFNVQVEAGIHAATGQVYAMFWSIDPDTDLPPGALTGFLPPEDGTGRGKGSISFVINPKQGLLTGTQIRTIAQIIFDGQPPIATNQKDPHDPSQGTDPAKEALITIDAAPPSSAVSALPATVVGHAIGVSWSGSDDSGGSGIAAYSVYVSTDDGEFVIWKSRTTSTSGVFTGVEGHTYRFYSIAIDNTGQHEAAPAAADAVTTLQAAPFGAAAGQLIGGSAGPDGNLNLTVENGAGLPIVLQQAAGSSNWTGADLQAKTGCPTIVGEVITWVDPKDGLTYAAAMSASGLILFTNTGGTVWTFRDLGTEVAGIPAITGNLTTFTSTNGIVSIAGVAANGDLIRYYQSGGAAGDYQWTAINHGDELRSQGLAMPQFVGRITSFVTPWDALNIVGLDANGQIQAVWWHQSLQTGGKWTTNNLSLEYGAPQLAGGLTVWLTSWDAINIAGTDVNGKLSVTWWVPNYNDNKWNNDNLTDEFSGPSLEPSSMTSWVTPWGAMNIAGRESDGTLGVYWWVPNYNNNQWNVVHFRNVVPSATRTAGPVTGLTAPGGDYSMSIVSTSDSGDVIRTWWQPSTNVWAEQNITQVAVPA